MLNLHTPDPDHNRFGFYLANALLLGVALLIAYALSGCHNPYEIAKKRFANEKVDTTYTTVTLTVPRDSLVLRVKTDTTHLVETVKQGRATVTIIREPKITTVYANCDSVTKKQVVINRTVRQYWGVDPKFEKWADIWRTATFVLLGIIGLVILMNWLINRLKFLIPSPDGPKS